MKKHYLALAPLVLICFLSNTNGYGLSLPSIPSLSSLGSLLGGSTDIDKADTIDTVTDAIIDKESNSSTKKPPVSTNNQNNQKPQRPLNLGSLQALLPSKSTIYATKTVHLEVTKKVIEHPVCISVHGRKPPCLSQQGLQFGGFGIFKEDEKEHENEEEKVEGGFQINPTASVEMVQPTMYTGAAFDSASSPLYQDEEIIEQIEGTEGDDEGREGRYINMRTPLFPVKSEPEISEQPEEDPDGRLIEGLLDLANNWQRPETHYYTKTQWVTKIQKVIDKRVTATLEVKNCFPAHITLPFCKGHYYTDYGVNSVPHQEIHGGFQGLYGLPLKPGQKPLQKPQKPLIEAAVDLVVSPFGHSVKDEGSTPTSEPKP